MTAHPATYWSLTCDGTDSEGCTEAYWDTENECIVLANSLELLHEWARDAGWVRYGTKDLCPGHTHRAASGPHTFTPATDGVFCALCKEWADDARHHAASPGRPHSWRAAHEKALGASRPPNPGHPPAGRQPIPEPEDRTMTTTTPRQAALAAYQRTTITAYSLDDETGRNAVAQTCTAIFNSPGIQAMLTAHEEAILTQTAARIHARADEIPNNAPRGARHWARAVHAAAHMISPPPPPPADQQRTNEEPPRRNTEHHDRAYLHTGTVAHLIPPGRIDTSHPAHCGQAPTQPTGAWHGTGSQAEYERAAALPLCKDCEKESSK